MNRTSLASAVFAFAVATLPLSAQNFIVEFRDAPPEAMASSSLTRFRSDLQAIEPRSSKTSETSPKIEREFTRLFHGAAVRLEHSSSVRRILELPYVANVHLDREVLAGMVTEGPAGYRDQGTGVESGGKGVVVAVIDSGVDYLHPALGGGFGPGHKVLGGWDFANDDADPMDDNRHGTHVAGIIAARSVVVTGLAPEASLLVYKVLDSQGKGKQSHVLAALELAVDPNGDGDHSDRADVINLSLGSPGHPDDPVARAADRASALGSVVVASVGNSGEEHSIGSPALAHSVIAVGAVDGGRQVAEFSAHGPAAQSAAVKPDVLAPGVLIRSTAIGGGTLALSGTSMAAPYVAAIAARILEQYPDWSPDRVRSAIVYSGYPIPGTPVLAQGTGPVDIPTALSSGIYIQPNPLGFGVVERSAATWRATRSIGLRNELDVPITIVAEEGDHPSAVSFTFRPSSILLQPGVDAAIEVDIEVDLAALDAASYGLALGSWVKLSRGAVDYYVPWSIISAARVRTSFPTEFPQLIWSTDRVVRGSIVPIDPYTFETLLAPGTYDLAAVGATDGEAFVVVRDALAVDGDVSLDFTEVHAPFGVQWAASDPAGGPLAHPNGESSLYTMAGRLLFADGERKWSIEFPGEITALRSSTLSSRWSLLLSETSVDTATGRLVVAQHPPLTGFDSDVILRNDPADYLAQPIEAHFPVDAAERSVWFLPRGMTRRPSEIGRKPDGIGIENFTSTWKGTVWMTPEVHSDYESGVQVGLYTGDAALGGTASLVVPMTRRRGDAFISSFDFAPAPLPIETRPDATLRWGAGAIWPAIRLVLTSAGVDRHVWSGSFEVIGDRNELRRRETVGTTWRLLSQNGNQLHAGQVGLGGLITPASSARRLELLVSSPETGPFPSAGGRLEISMAESAGGDVTPPSLTSLAILDGDGNHSRRIRHGSAARLIFSAADYLLTPEKTAYQPVAEGLTKVWARQHGAETWQELEARAMQEDGGDEELLGRSPAGHIFETDLSTSQLKPGLVDLRIELNDRSGHRTRWTLSPALEVSTERRRPVQR